MQPDTTPAPIGADALMRLVDAYAETRHTCGDASYNAKSKEARDAVRAALASAAQPADAVAYGLEAWVDGAWHLQWPLRPTEADAEQDRAMYSADAKLRLVRLSAAAPKAAPAPGLKGHEAAALVNRLRDVALQYRDTQQLRERIAQEIRPLVAGLGAAPAPAAQGDALPEGWGVLDYGEGGIILYNSKNEAWRYCPGSGADADEEFIYRFLQDIVARAAKEGDKP